MLFLVIPFVILMEEPGPISEAQSLPKDVECEFLQPPCGWAHGPLGENLFVYSIAWTWEVDVSDKNLWGITVGAGPYGGEPDEFWSSAFGGLWLSFQKDHSLEIYGAGMEFVPEIPIGPTRIGPRFKLGLEYRNGQPDQGIGGIAGLGGEFGLWFGRRIELVFIADREFNFPSGTSNKVQWLVRFGGREETWWPGWWPFNPLGKNPEEKEKNDV